MCASCEREGPIVDKNAPGRRELRTSEFSLPVRSDDQKRTPSCHCHCHRHCHLILTCYSSSRAAGYCPECLDHPASPGAPPVTHIHHFCRHAPYRACIPQARIS